MAAKHGRDRRRRGRFGFLYKLLSVLLILGAVVGGCIVFFRVETVTVTGSTVYSDEEIIAASGVEQGDNLFLVNKILVGRRLVSQLPYISAANIRRALPDELVITVTQCVSAGVLEDENGSWWIVDTTCKLLEQGGSELKSRGPLVTGLVPLMPAAGEKLAVSMEQSVKLDALRQILSALEQRELLEKVQSIDLTGEAEIHMEYEGRLDVRMPLYSDDFDHLIRVVGEAAASAALSDGQRGVLDLIVEDGSQAHFIPE